MKNLIYTICDNNYKDLLPFWINSIRTYNDVDLLVISSPNFSSSDLTYIHHVDHQFDYKYTSKFLINRVSDISDYDNFLFLDLDIICKSNLDDLFIKISSDIDKIHGVKETESLILSDKFHRFDNINQFYITDDDIGYNAGTFGFNKNLLNVFDQFLQFINNNKSYAYCDQPAFNMFFNDRKLLLPSLSEFVYLDGHEVNSTNAESCRLFHFLGCYGDIGNKIKRIECYVKD
jgi:lipopolysaccharide biosynthesis glycosyltransferase